MNTALLAAAICLTALTAATLWLRTKDRALDEPTACRFTGCRRLSTTSVVQWHPAGTVTLRFCDGHARRWAQPPYNWAADQLRDVVDGETS